MVHPTEPGTIAYTNICHMQHIILHPPPTRGVIGVCRIFCCMWHILLSTKVMLLQEPVLLAVR
jgi:hypothetical protein